MTSQSDKRPNQPRQVWRPYRLLGLGLLTVALWLLWITPQQAADQNLLNNPGFEGTYRTLAECPARIQGLVAQGWDDNTCWDATAQISYARDTTIKHRGAAAQRIQLRSGRLQFAHFSSLRESQLYTATLWLRAQNPMPVELVLRQVDAPYQVYASRTFTVTTTWQPVMVRGLTPTSASFFMLLTTTPGTLWLDDAALTSTPWTSPLPQNKTIPRTFFGMHIHSATSAWPAVDEQIGTVRVWDADGPPVGAQWAAINPSPGVYDWTALDAYVQRALAHHADILMNLGRTPQWASARPNEPSPYGPGQAAEPATAKAWQEWVQAVGTRYRGRIKYWEIWNEPNVPDFFTGTPETLVELARQAYIILKAIDPMNQIVLPSATSSLAYLDQYLAAGGGAYADIIGYHFYVDTAPEVLFTSYIPNVWITLANHGLHQKPLWNTEEGWLRPTPNGPKTLTDEKGAAYLARAYLLNWASGVSRYYFYAWDNHGYMNIDLTQTDGTTMTPAAIAYREVAHWLIGAQMRAVDHAADDTWTIQLKRGDGTLAYVVWNPTKVRTFTIPTAWSIQRQRDLSGKVTSLAKRQAITVNEQPVLLEQTPFPQTPTPTAVQPSP